MGEIKRSLSKRLVRNLSKRRVTSLGGSDIVSNTSSSMVDITDGLQSLKYDETSTPVSTNSSIISRPPVKTHRTSTSSLPSLLKKHKALDPVICSRLSVSSVATPQEIAKPIDEPKEVVKPLKLDLLPSMPLKSPSSEEQLSPTLPQRLTTPIMESIPFFGLPEYEQCQHFLPAFANRSRQNSSVTSCTSSGRDLPSTPEAVDNNSVLLNYLNDPAMNRLIFNKEFSNCPLSNENGELESVIVDELALNILEKTSETPIEQTAGPCNEAAYTKWFI